MPIRGLYFASTGLIVLHSRRRAGGIGLVTFLEMQVRRREIREPLGAE